MIRYSKKVSDHYFKHLINLTDKSAPYKLLTPFFTKPKKTLDTKTPFF
jgi:hypothetical protein